MCREDKCLINIIEKGKNGFTYTDEAEYVEYITTILHNRELQQLMAKKSIMKSYAFSKEIFVSTVEQLYEDILARHEEGEVVFTDDDS